VGREVDRVRVDREEAGREHGRDRDRGDPPGGGRRR
jgi:hypothetical protein